MIRALGTLWIWFFLSCATHALADMHGGFGEKPHRELGYITLPDGVRLAYIAYWSNKPGRFPTVLQYDAYFSSGIYPDDWNSLPDMFVNNGYVFVGVNVRGSGCSGGTFSFLDPQQGKDGAEVIEWIARQKWSNGNIGMVGDSYPGHTQFLTAPHRPPHLKALAAGGLTADIYKDTCFHGGIANAYCANWGYFAQPALAARGVQRRQSMGDMDCRNATVSATLPSPYAEIAHHPLHDEWWISRALETSVAKIDVPTLIIQGWQDNETAMPGPMRLFRELRISAKRLVMMNGGHFVYLYSLPEVLRWMDHWLKGVPNGVDAEDPVNVWFETTVTNMNAHPAWRTSFSKWPPDRTELQDWYLSEGGQLTRVAADAAQPGARSYVFPSGSEMISDNSMFSDPPVSWGSLSYRTKPTDHDVTIVGSPQLILFVSTDQRDTDFMVALHDVGPDGSILFLQRDYLRASMRHIDPARSYPDDRYFTFDRAEPLTPGEVYEIDFSIMPFAHVLRTGHTLELVIMSPPSIATPNWGLTPLSLVGKNTVYQSKEYPSKLVLPTIPDLKAQGAEPECGSLEFQPCRRNYDIARN